MALDAWVRRFLIFSDGISYLEIADAYARRDWSAALNSHWSPMYSWLLALANVVIRPSPEWAVPVLHAVQVAAILAVLPAFEYLLKKVSPFAANAKVFRIASYAALIWVVIVLVSAEIAGRIACYSPRFASYPVCCWLTRNDSGLRKPLPWAGFLDFLTWRRAPCFHLDL